MVVPSLLRSHAAINHMWISASNACNQEQTWSSRGVEPDGRVAFEADRNVTGVSVFEVSPERFAGTNSAFERWSEGYQDHRRLALRGERRSR
jgi:predicted amidohydrolase